MNKTIFLSIALLILLLPCSALSITPDCQKCHEKLLKEKIVHPAIAMGCEACHTNIDASTVPHKNTGKIAHGLSSDQPTLCYGCHDSSLFTKKDVHPALSMGCTVCHNPHSSAYAKLLVAQPPELCFTCHDKAGFTNKLNNHLPVAQGKCLICHTPHSSDEMALLLKKPMDVCLGCHENITHGGHNTMTPGKELQDPLRPGKPFYCGTCHNPHGSNGVLMFRFDAQSAKSLCEHCHKY